MFDKLESVERRYIELGEALAAPGVDPREYSNLAKERASLSEIIETFQAHKQCKKSLAEAKQLLEQENDEDLRGLAKEELGTLEPQLEELAKKLTLLLLPKDPNDEKNIILEIRAGTGGDEAAIFTGDLLRMYKRFADRIRWKTEILSSTPSEKGGFREVIVMIEGDRVFSQLKFESGAHRVQRVPATEAQGRVHTSACTVAILPEADEVEVKINPADLDISVFRSSGAGGQSVNTTDSAVRIVHRPTGVMVECQDERSQLKNKERGMKILKARLLEKAQQAQHAEIAAQRKTQVGSGDRSERIRTYNFPQSRMTDHRIDLTLYKLSDIMDGDLRELLDALMTHHQSELLKDQAAVGSHV